jgi:tRNA(Ile)-lysidine synthetase-like protein
MLSRVSRTIGEHGLFAGSLGTRVLVAVSGGSDSMAMLACLWELSGRLGLTLEVAVIDHGLRPEAAREVALVAERASALGLPFHRLRVDVGAARAGRPSPGGIQEVARRLRLEALSRLAGTANLGTVALGHNANDQAETVLFRILRGTGIDGLAGIPYRRPPFVRPLLDVWRPEILEYLRARSLTFIEDPSNHDFRYTRARIRHRILPALRQENPRLDEALHRLAAAAAGRFPDAEVLEKLAIPARVALPVAAAVRAGRGTQSFDLSDSRRIVVTYGQVRVIQGAGRDGATGHVDNQQAGGGGVSGGVSVLGIEVQIAGAGAHPLGEAGALFVRELASDGPPAGDLPWFDGDRLAWPLTLRSRRPGDRMRPRGGRGSRKVADLMIDAKIPLAERAHLPVVAGADGEVLFVAGLRPSEIGRPCESTRRWIGFDLRPGPRPSQSGQSPGGRTSLVDPTIPGSNTHG